MIQSEGRWASESYKTYTRNNREDSRHISRKLADEEKGVKRQPEEGTVLGKNTVPTGVQVFLMTSYWVKEMVEYH